MTPDSPPLGRLAVRNTIWLTLFFFASQLISFVAVILLTRLLGPQIFGVFAMGTFWSSLLALRPKFGLTYAALRQPALDGELFGSFFGLDLILSTGSVILGIIAALALPRLGYPVEVSVVVIVLMICEFLPALFGPYGLALEKELQLSRTTAASLIATVCAYGLAVVLALSGAGLWSLLVMSLVNVSLSLIGLYIVCRRRLPQVFRIRWKFSRPVAKRLLAQGLPVGLSNQGLTTVVSQYDNFLIGTFVGTTMLGYYDRAFRLSQWPNILLTQVLVRVGFLTFAKVQDDTPRLTHAMRLSLWVVTTLGIPMVLVLTLGASEVVTVLYGPAWVASSFFLRFLAVYTLFTPFISLASSLAYAVGNVRMTVWITAAQVMTIVVVATLLTLVFGAVGTVLGVGVTVTVGFAISVLYIFRRLPLSARAVFGAPLIAIIIASTLTLLVMSWSGWNDLTALIRLIIIGCTAAGGYLISLTGLAAR